MAIRIYRHCGLYGEAFAHSGVFAVHWQRWPVLPALATPALVR